jgi:hypothetical protein
MDVRKIIAEIDAKIGSLQQARAVLIGLNDVPVEVKPRRGRPKGSTNAARAAAAAAATTAPSRVRRKKRVLSPEGRKRIAEAMKRRWEERRNAAPKAARKAVGKKVASAK